MSAGTKRKLDKTEIFKIAGYLGAALVTAGALRYWLQDALLLPSKIMLLAGAVLLVASLGLNFREVAAYFSRRSAKLGTNTLVMAAAVMVILGLVDFVTYRHHKRFDLTAEKLYTLSDQTQRIVGGLRKDVQILRFSKTADTELRDRMTEYTNLSPHIHFERVDPDERPEMAKQYGVTRGGDVVVACGTRNEHLSETTEQDITNAILKVTRDTVKTVCFVEGHGEKSITDTGATGYSGAEAQLTKESYQVRGVNLVTSGQVPPECSVLVIAGPTQGFFPQETAMVGKYLDAGGKAMIETDPDTDSKLDDIYQAWNIAVGKNAVIDVSGVGRLFGTGPGVPLVLDYGVHPITRKFERSMTFFPLARTVSIADHSRSQPEETELLKTSAASWAAAKISGPRVAFNPATDTKGPLSLGIAAERKEGGKSARLVVIGDSDFASNRWMGLQRNGDLFFNAINWLSEDEDLISVRPKNPANRRVTLTEGQQKTLYWTTLVLLPGLVILCGLVIWWKRR